MITFSAQIERAFGAMCYSTARRALSDRSLSQLPYAAHLELHSDMLSRSLCSSVRLGKLLGCGSRVCDKFSHSGHQSHKRPLVATTGTGRSKSNVCKTVSSQMTTIHPIPVFWPQAHLGLARKAFHSTAGVCWLFFEPTTHSITRNAESASQTTQRRALFISSQDLFTFLFGVAIRLRIITAAAIALITVIALFAVSGQAIADEIVATAMAAL
jgi:hypothetical protein